MVRLTLKSARQIARYFTPGFKAALVQSKPWKMSWKIRCTKQRLRFFSSESASTAQNEISFFQIQNFLKSHSGNIKVSSCPFLCILRTQWLKMVVLKIFEGPKVVKIWSKALNRMNIHCVVDDLKYHDLVTKSWYSSEIIWNAIFSLKFCINF